MPSPVGHSLGGLAAGWLAGGCRARRWFPVAIALAGAAVLPDLDLLWGAHHQATHSLAAVSLVAILAHAWGIWANRRSLALPIAAAYGSHILLDLLGADSTPPIGVMLFWPVSDEYMIAPWTPFPAISRRYWLSGFWAHNLRAVAFELAVLGPIAGAVWAIRRRNARES